MSILNEHKNKYQRNWGTFCNTEDIKNIRELIGFKNNKGFDYLYNENYCRDLSESNNFLYGGHPSELGHQKIADYIILKIKNASFI